MRKIAALLLLMFSALCFADQTATTEDGRKVILRDDGTWVYVKKDRTSATKADDEYADANDVIDSKCKRDWPSDPAMESTCRNQQKDAVKKLKAGKPQGIEEEDYTNIHEKCKRDFSDDFMRRYTCESQQFLHMIMRKDD